MHARRIVLVGDSIAYGRGDQHGIGWSGLLQREHVAQDAESNRYFNLSISGIGSAEVRRIVQSEVPFRSPDLVVLAYGINDARRVGSRSGPYPLTMEHSADLFASNIEDIRSLGSEVLAVGLIKPDTSRTMPLFGDYFDTVPALDLEKRLADICKQLEVPRVNLWSLFDGHPDRLVDGLHPEALAIKRSTRLSARNWSKHTLRSWDG